MYIYSTYIYIQMVNHQIAAESLPCSGPQHISHYVRSVPLSIESNLDRLAARVSSKSEEGDFTGAVRLSVSSDSVAIKDASTIVVLQSKHPPPHHDTYMPQNTILEDIQPLMVTENEVRAAIVSFMKGSAGGPDGLRPQHLLDMIHPTTGHDGESLLTCLTVFVNLDLSGRVPVSVRHIFFGASLTALSKANGGV